MKTTVVAIVANVKRFRVRFYELLASSLAANDIALRVVYSDPNSNEWSKGDSVDLTEAIGRKVSAISLFGNRLLLQRPPMRLLAKADLIIIVQANGYLLNYPLLIAGLLNAKRVAFWGHAFNHQGNAKSISERFKRWLATKVGWWFTYTQLTARYLKALDYPVEKITILENAVDTTGFAEQVSAIPEADVIDLRMKHEIPRDAHVGIYCGSLYPEKQIDFMIALGDRLSISDKKIVLLVIGDGPNRDQIVGAASTRNWLIYLGSRFGAERAQYFAAADFFLHPGAVGLGILDSFAAGLPFVTSNFAGHGPEIAYLDDGENGLMLPLQIDQFQAGLIRLLNSPSELARLRLNAKASGARYTIENMVENATAGILNCLAAEVMERRRNWQ